MTDPPIDLDHSGALVPDLLSAAVRRFPNKTAVTLDGRSLSFAELSERASRLADALRSRGSEPGSRVALLALNELEYLEIRVGAQRAGVVLVPLNYRLSEQELFSIVEDAEVDLLIVGPEFHELAGRLPAPAALRIGADREGPDSYERALQAATAGPVPAGYPPEDICQISYTSGTTARPKGVMLSNRAIHAGTVAMGHELQSHPHAVFLACTPLFHIGSQVPFSCTMLGGTLVQMRKFEVAEFLAVLDRSRATHCQLVPAMIRMVLDEWGERSTSSLRRVLYGAAPMPPSLLAEAIATWGCEFVNGYGSTESTGISFLTSDEHDPDGAPELLASVGRSSMLTTSRLVDENGVDVRQGEIGEVLARSAALMSGYWRNPEATGEALRAGWMHTGDMAYRDENGFMYLVDRRNDKIVTGGENVYPSEVEHVLDTHPSVVEAGVIGMPDRRWGEAVSAVVVLREGEQVSNVEILDYCRQSLASYKVPKTVRFASEPLPRTPTGKLLRRALRQDWSEIDATA